LTTLLFQVSVFKKVITFRKNLAYNFNNDGDVYQMRLRTRVQERSYRYLATRECMLFITKSNTRLDFLNEIFMNWKLKISLGCICHISKYH